MIALHNERYLEQRRRELQPYLDMFSRQLSQIFEVMPAPRRIYHFLTGEWEVINDPEWQKLIDRIVKQQQEYIEINFPEFYQSLNKDK